MSLKQQALAYAEQYSWPVFPLSPGTKVPLKGSQGVKDACTDRQMIEAWWDEHPDANIGIATGPAGLAVLDADSHADDWGPEAQELWDDLPETLTVKTPKGGQHKIYTGHIRSTARHIALGIDTRGEGGYVVAPPSRVGGRQYEWLVKTPPVPVPPRVNELLDGPAAKQRVEVTSDEPPKGSRYGLTVLDGETSKLAFRVTPGSRNNDLFASAVRIFELVKAGELDRDHALHTLGTVLTVWQGHDDPFPESEFKAVLSSAWKRAEAKPIDTPDGEEDTLHTVGRYLTLDDLAHMPPPRWLIPGVLPEGVSLLHGKFASGKTFVSLDLSLSMASHGKVVVYCAGEGVSGLHSRVEAWSMAHPDLDPTQGFVVLANDAFPRLADPYSASRFLRDMDIIAERYGHPDLVVLDTWRRVLAPQSVNGDETVAQAFLTLDGIRSKYASSTLIIHHPRKTPGEGGATPPEAGSGALMDNIEFAWKLWAVDDHDKRLYNTKAKDFEEQSPLSFMLKPVANSLVVEPSVSELMY